MDRLVLFSDSKQKGILDYAAESDLQENNTMLKTEHMLEKEVVVRQFDYTGEKECDQNAEIFISCIKSAAKLSKNSFAAIKITGISSLS